MKKLILLVVIAISIISCTDKTVITEKCFVDNLNSFDSTAVYGGMQLSSREVIISIIQNDSLFLYHVERCYVADNIFANKYVGDKVK